MASSLNRRKFLSCLGAGTASFAIAPLALAEEKGQKFVKTTFTYKKVGRLEMKADVFRPNDDNVRPVVLWIHGGALIMGTRSGVDRRVMKRALHAGYALVSIDYRLAPETKLPEIVEDVEDAYAWVYKKGPELFLADRQKIAVLGGTAGGYLTLTCGFRAEPRPAALVSFWGYGDLIGDWYSKPSEFYRKQPRVSKEKAFRGVDGPPVADGTRNPKRRHDFYLFCRQNGLWPKLVAGFDPQTQSKAFAPYMPVRNVTNSYHPTMIHGAADTDVPYEQSVLMQKQFQQHDVPHKFITVENAGHGLSDADPKVVSRMYDQVFAFVHRYFEKQLD